MIAGTIVTLLATWLVHTVLAHLWVWAVGQDADGFNARPVGQEGW